MQDVSTDKSHEDSSTPPTANNNVPKWRQSPTQWSWIQSAATTNRRRSLAAGPSWAKSAFNVCKSFLSRAYRSIVKNIWARFTHATDSAFAYDTSVNFDNEVFTFSSNLSNAGPWTSTDPESTLTNPESIKVSGYGLWLYFLAVRLSWMDPNLTPFVTAAWRQVEVCLSWTLFSVRIFKASDMWRTTDDVETRKCPTAQRSKLLSFVTPQEQLCYINVL